MKQSILRKNSTVNDNSIKKVFAYIRKSTTQDSDGNDRRQFNSLIVQKRLVKEIEKRNNLKIVKTFEDSESAYKAYVRKSFQEMCEQFESQGIGGEIKGIVCSEHNRIARNFADGGRVLWFLQNGEIEAIYTHDKVFTNSSNDQMMLAINFAMAKHSSDETRFRMKATWNEKALGGTPPNQRIVGYKYVGEKGVKKWELDPIKAPLIKKFFEAFATGKYQEKEMVNFAKVLGLVNPDTKRPYSANTIGQWLRKKEYTGIFEYEGEKYRGQYKPIISTELFYKVQEILLSRNNKRGQTKNTYAYSPSLIKCGVCGKYMTGDIQKGNIYYKCNHRYEPCKSEPDLRPQYLSESTIDASIKKELEKVELSKKRWNEISVLIKENTEYELSQYRRTVSELKTKISNEKISIKNNNKVMSKLRLKEKLSKEEDSELQGYQELNRDSELEIELFEKTIISIHEILSQLPLQMEDFIEQLKIATSMFDKATPNNRRVIIDTLCSNLTWDEKNLHWEWKNKYQLASKDANLLNWLRG